MDEGEREPEDDEYSSSDEDEEDAQREDRKMRAANVGENLLDTESEEERGEKETSPSDESTVVE